MNGILWGLNQLIHVKHIKHAQSIVDNKGSVIHSETKTGEKKFFLAMQKRERVCVYVCVCVCVCVCEIGMIITKI